MTDKYRNFLRMMTALAILAACFSGNKLYDYALKIQYFSQCGSIEQGAPGKLVWVEGTPRPNPSQPLTPKHKEIYETLWNIFEKDWGLSHVLVGEFLLYHTVGSGDDEETVTDLSLFGGLPFVLEQSGKTVQFRQPPHEIIFPQTFRGPTTDRLKSLAPAATHYRFRLFQANPAYLMGIFQLEQNGSIVLGSALGKPLILSSVPPRALLRQALFSFFLYAVVFGFYLWITIRGPYISILSADPSESGTLKSRFAGDPNRFFIFDLTGGPEKIGIVLMCLYLAAQAVAIFVLTWDNPTTYHAVVATSLLLGLILFNSLKRLEWFYVVDKDEQKLFEINRGFLGTVRRELMHLDDLQPLLREAEDSEGNTSHTIVSGPQSISHLFLSDAYSEDYLAGVIRDFQRWADRAVLVKTIKAE
jgi:hypothetical protein